MPFECEALKGLQLSKNNNVFKCNEQLEYFGKTRHLSIFIFELCKLSGHSQTQESPQEISDIKVYHLLSAGN